MVRTLLLEEKPLVIQPSLAVAIGGINEAIILQQLHYWLNNSKHHYEGRKWIYNKMSEWNKQFPFWSLRTVERTFKKLIDSKIIITANFNKSKIDKTIWYSIDYEALNEKTESYYKSKQEQADDNTGESSPKGDTSGALRQNDGIEVEDLPPRTRQNDESKPTKCQLHTDNLGEAIPETTTENNTENINSQSVSQSDIDKANEGKEGLTQDKPTEKQLLEQLLQQCDIASVCEDTSIARSVTTAIQNLFYNSAFAHNNLGLPLEVVRDNLNSLEPNMIAYAVSKMQKEAAYGKTIFSPVKYLQSCIYNAISEYPASLLVDCELAQMAVNSKQDIESTEPKAEPASIGTEGSKPQSIVDTVKGTRFEEPINKLSGEMTAIAFKQYIEPARIEPISESEIRIIADNEFTAGILECRYKKLILSAFEPLGFRHIEVAVA